MTTRLHGLSMYRFCIINTVECECGYHLCFFLFLLYYKHSFYYCTSLAFFPLSDVNKTGRKKPHAACHVIERHNALQHDVGKISTNSFMSDCRLFPKRAKKKKTSICQRLHKLFKSICIPMAEISVERIIKVMFEYKSENCLRKMLLRAAVREKRDLLMNQN